MAFQEVMPLAELWPGEKVAVELGGLKILLVNLDGRIVAYENRCAHQGVPLSLGCLAGNKLTCAVHHWEFDLSSGCGINPAQARLKSYPVRIADDRILVDPLGGVGD